MERAGERTKKGREVGERERKPESHRGKWLTQKGRGEEE
jgi:hypothetical protein